MYKSISSFLIITLAVFSFHVQTARAEIIVDIVDAVVDTVTTVADVIINEVSIIVDVVAIVVVSVVTLGLCSPAGPCSEVLDPFVDDLTCRNVIGANGEIFIDCDGNGNQLPGSGGPGSIAGSLSTLSTSGGSQTCTQVYLSGVNPQGHNWALLRDGAIVKQLTPSDTSYTDTGLTPHTNYSYVVRLPYPAESGFTTSDSAPLDAYTKCLPQCGFGVDTSSIAEFSSTNLRWKCINNDPGIDVGSCRITDSTGALSQAVDAVSGELSVSPTADTTYTLQCTNIDGPISIPQNISVFKPGIKEIKP